VVDVVCRGTSYRDGWVGEWFECGTLMILHWLLPFILVFGIGTIVCLFFFFKDFTFEKVAIFFLLKEHIFF